MQASTEIPYGTPPNVIEVFSLGNAGNAKIYGLDSDLTWRMTQELSLRGGHQLLDAKIVSGAYDDETPVQSPKVSANVALRYQSAQPVASVLPFAQADYNYRSSVYFTLPNVAADSQGGYGLLGLRAGAEDGRFEVGMVGLGSQRRLTAPTSSMPLAPVRPSCRIGICMPSPEPSASMSDTSTEVR